MLDPNAIPFIQKLERYGKVISDDEFNSPVYGLTLNSCGSSTMYRFVRVKIIRLQHCVYKVVKADGQYIQYSLIGRMPYGQE